MKTPAQVQAHIEASYERNLATWLACPDAVDIDLALGLPGEQLARKDLGAVIAWVQQWRQAATEQHNWQVSFTSRKWRVMGVQELPERVVIKGALNAAKVADKEEDWLIFRARLADLSVLVAEHGLPDSDNSNLVVSRLAKLLVSNKAAVRALLPADWQRVLNVVSWLLSNPNSGLYLRAIPVPGMDTKWLGRHQGLVGNCVEALRELLGLPGGKELCLAACGALYRLVWADEDLRPGGIRTASLPLAQVLDYQCKPGVVLICENLQTVLALPDMPGVIAIHGLGGSVTDLAAAEWIQASPVVYWGDIDSHGFAILSALRQRLPQVVSVLMDADTLWEHQDLCVEEPKPTFADLPLLTSAEQQVYQSLQNPEWVGNKVAGQVRLEQERISWAWAMPRLSAALAALHN